MDHVGEVKKGRYIPLEIANSTNNNTIHSLQIAIASFSLFGKTRHGHYMVFNIAFNIYNMKLLLSAHEPLYRHLSTIPEFFSVKVSFPSM